MSVLVHQAELFAPILVTGEDAAEYLQSQWTIDLLNSKEKSVAYGLRLNRKGRVLADAYLFKFTEERLVLASQSLPSEELIELMEENVVADDVDFASLPSPATVFTFWSQDLSPLLHFAGFPGELAPNSFLETSLGLLHAGRMGSTPCLRLLSTPEESSFLREILSEPEVSDRLCFVEEQVFHRSRLSAGVPLVPVEIGPDELPQEGGLEADAVDFAKGCYLGQEVMARIHAMGRPQRGLRSLFLPEHPPPAPLPMPLYLGDKEVGVLKSYYPSPDSTDGLGMGLLRLKHLDEIGQVGLSFVPSGAPSLRLNAS